MKKVNRFMYWVPRLLGIIFILFLMMFSLDVFEPGLTVWQIVVGLFMHNIPALILLIILIISWKYEIVGGIIFTLVGVFFVFNVLILAIPALVVGILFMINWFKNKK